MIANKYPLVSIITPVYNGAKFLDQLIQSVQQQTYPFIEHILVDDGSTDDGATVDILRRYEHLKWWSRENHGQYTTMNDGLFAASGDVICFISADDLMLPNAVNQAITYLSSNPAYAGVYGGYVFIDSNGNSLRRFHPMRLMPTVLYPYSLHIAHSSLYVKRDFLLKNKLFFDAKLKYVGDYEWIIRLLRAKEKIKRARDNYSAIRVHNEQTSKVKFYEMKKERWEIQKKMHISLIIAWAFRKIMFLSDMINVQRDSDLRTTLTEFVDRLKRVISRT